MEAGVPARLTGETPVLHRRENSVVFNQVRDVNNLKGKCGCCEFRNICMGCRARAHAATGNYLDEEPFCAYQPRTTSLKQKDAALVELAR